MPCFTALRGSTLINAIQRLLATKGAPDGPDVQGVSCHKKPFQAKSCAFNSACASETGRRCCISSKCTPQKIPYEQKVKSTPATTVDRELIAPRYMLGSAIGVLLLYNVFTKVVFTPLDRLADEFEKEEGIPDTKTPEDLDGSLFIPFPGTIKQIPQSPYRGSDPEWQEYIKFSKDLALMNEVRTELAEIARRSVANAKGGEGARILKHWLDVNYPYSPPPAFVHSGIEITDEFISWSTVPIEEETVLRIRQALFPVAVAKATWKFVQVLFSQDPEEKTRSIMRAHFKIPDPVETKKTYPALASSDKKVTQARVTGGLGVTAQAGNYNHSTSQQTQESAKQSDLVGQKVLQTQSDAASAAKNNGNQNRSGQPEQMTIRDTMLYQSMAKRCTHAIFTFRFTNTANWKQVKVIPRGSVVITGWVEMETKLNFVIVEVVGNYPVVYFEIMALAPKFYGQLFSSLSHAPKVHTLEVYLDYVCPFSKKQFETIYEKVFPIIKTKYTGRINVIFRQQVQPWHPSSTLVHEAGVAALRLDPAAFWAYSAVLFKHQTEFFDVNVVNETRNQTYRRLAKLYGALGASGPGTHQADEERLYKLLVVGEKAGEGGALNIGNKVTDDLKLLIKLGRQTGTHVSPTVLWDGLVDNSISSSWTVEQWDKYFEEKVHK
ncbi:hypothetical protein V491_06320 [Pseudogymnoascus sp. VKM F-3775]|nr:hypothetical protein V491_06320 [Pseudogymnoascus sp. VKM F-3775]